VRERAALALVALLLAAVASTAAAADGGRATCEHQSTAGFPNAFGDAHNLVVGPLVLVGGRTYTPPDAARRFGGQKFAALVAAGHRVRIAISRRARANVALTYADSVHGSRSLSDGVRVVRFERCSRDEAGSTAGRRPVTFWSGFILTNGPRCVHLKVWIDGASKARRASIPIGRRC
jgi:hypothetical protein